MGKKDNKKKQNNQVISCFSLLFSESLSIFSVWPHTCLSVKGFGTFHLLIIKTQHLTQPKDNGPEGATKKLARKAHKEL